MTHMEGNSTLPNHIWYVRLCPNPRSKFWKHMLLLTTNFVFLLSANTPFLTKWPTLVLPIYFSNLVL